MVQIGPSQYVKLDLIALVGVADTGKAVIFLEDGSKVHAEWKVPTVLTRMAYARALVTNEQVTVGWRINAGLPVPRAIPESEPEEPKARFIGS
jgi:hypothetical protein